LAFDIHEYAAQSAHMPIQVRRFGALQIGEKASDPGSEMFFEYLLVGAFGRRELAVHDTRHDFAQRRGMILGLDIAFRAFDAKRCEIGAQPRQRTLVQETSEIV